VLDKPISRFSKILSKGQCQASIGKLIIFLTFVRSKLTPVLSNIGDDEV
jgi:hypothetical protein